MDIRRMPLWASRNATIMSNEAVRAVIEDQGEITIELSCTNIQGGRVNALSIPYFRGIGAGVLSDENIDWYKSKQRTYTAGGIYISFPSSDEDHILTSNSYWMLRRYGSESTYGGVWRLSEMKSREENNRYHISKIDFMLPSDPVLYTYLKLTNTDEVPLEYNLSIHSMVSPPLLESGSLISTSAAEFTAYPPNLREVAFNRLKSGIHFSDLKHCPSIRGQNIDMSYVPGPTSSYDYIIGELKKDYDLGWVTIINPRQQLLYCSFFPSLNSDLPQEYIKFPLIDIAFNYLGRMDSPWALYEGGTPQVFSLTTGFGQMNHHGAFSSPITNTIPPGESRVVVYGNGYSSFDNPRIGLGFYSAEKAEHGLVFKRTKSYAYLPCDYKFKKLIDVASWILNNNE